MLSDARSGGWQKRSRKRSRGNYRAKSRSSRQGGVRRMRGRFCLPVASSGGFGERELAGFFRARGNIARHIGAMEAILGAPRPGYFCLSLGGAAWPLTEKQWHGSHFDTRFDAEVLRLRFQKEVISSNMSSINESEINFGWVPKIFRGRWCCRDAAVFGSLDGVVFFNTLARGRRIWTD